MNLNFSHRQELALECSVCGNRISREDELHTSQMKKLFGALQYAVCCCCGQEVAKPWGAAYKRRWGRWFRKHQGKEET